MDQLSFSAFQCYHFENFFLHKLTPVCFSFTRNIKMCMYVIPFLFVLHAIYRVLCNFISLFSAYVLHFLELCVSTFLSVSVLSIESSRSFGVLSSEKKVQGLLNCMSKYKILPKKWTRFSNILQNRCPVQLDNIFTEKQNRSTKTMYGCVVIWSKDAKITQGIGPSLASKKPIGGVSYVLQKGSTKKVKNIF